MVSFFMIANVYGAARSLSQVKAMNLVKGHFNEESPDPMQMPPMCEKFKFKN